MKEGAGVGEQTPCPPPVIPPPPSQRAAPRDQEELPARPLSVQVSRPCSGSGGQAPGEARRPRIGQGSEEAETRLGRGCPGLNGDCREEERGAGVWGGFRV